MSFVNIVEKQTFKHTTLNEHKYLDAGIITFLDYTYTWFYTPWQPNNQSVIKLDNQTVITITTTQPIKHDTMCYVTILSPEMLTINSSQIMPYLVHKVY